jgi:hypothetical protein
MVTYITRLTFTEQEIKYVKQTVQRATAFNELVKRHGGATKSLYWTQGAYDLVATIDAPDEESGLADPADARFIGQRADADVAGVHGGGNGQNRGKDDIAGDRGACRVESGKMNGAQEA